MRLDYQRAIDWVDDRITRRPGQVMLVFLVVTAVFAAGLGSVSTETGTEQFTSDIPEEAALEDVNRRFSPPFDAGEGTTQVIQSAPNVLSKPELLRTLELQELFEDRAELRVASTTSAAEMVANRLDPGARTTAERRIAVERATPSQIRGAVDSLAGDPGFTGLLSEDFNRRDATATATIAVVRHDLPVDTLGGAGQSGESPLTGIQRRAAWLAESVGGDVRVFGAGVFADEFSNVVVDSLLLIVPAAVALIVLFLILAYRDPLDLTIGVVALGMTIVWTLGFVGLAGIAFSQFLVAVPPLLLAVGIDFGIHAINRYREERQAGDADDALDSGHSDGHDALDGGDGDGPVAAAMRRATDQLLVAFFVVTGTTVVGFTANASSQLGPIREFGLVASVGIVFTFLIFGVFLPATKVYVEGLAERYPIPVVNQTPLGSAGSTLGRVLSVGAVISRTAPRAFLAVLLVGSVAAGVYAADVDTSFSNEDFLPPAETPAFLESLPEPFRPSEYTITALTNFLESKFEAGEDDVVTVYLEGPMTADYALESIARAGEDPPETFVRRGRDAEQRSVLTVIRALAARDSEFRDLVRRNDRDGNGIPDRDLGAVYDALFDSPLRGQALEYLTADRRSARVDYTVTADASQDAVTADARAVAKRHRFEATATGQVVVFQAISTVIFESAITSLALALAGTAVFLVAVYAGLEGRPSLGIANLVPIVVTLAMVAGTMHALDIAFNAFTATVLAITIGLGIDYSVHVVHRYVDERRSADVETAMVRTVQGTGGALAGSVVTTAAGTGVLVLAVFPVIGQFGFLTAVSVVYSFLTAILVTPSALVVWDRWVGLPTEVRP